MQMLQVRVLLSEPGGHIDLTIFFEVAMGKQRVYSGVIYNVLAWLVARFLDGAVICEECDD